MKKLENSIKLMRQKKGLTQEEVADAVGVSRQTIIAMEKGNYEPSLRLALLLANFFGMSVEDLYFLK